MSTAKEALVDGEMEFQFIYGEKHVLSTAL